MLSVKNCASGEKYEFYKRIDQNFGAKEIIEVCRCVNCKEVNHIERYVRRVL